MNFFPKEIEYIIMDYKYEIEKNEKYDIFIKNLNNKSRIKFLLCNIEKSIIFFKESEQLEIYSNLSNFLKGVKRYEEMFDKRGSLYGNWNDKKSHMINDYVEYWNEKFNKIKNGLE